MIGDQLDLWIMVEAARTCCTMIMNERDDDSVFADEEGPNHLLGGYGRCRLAKAANDLVAAFLAAEGAHRAQFCLSGTKEPSAVSCSESSRCRVAG